MFSVLLLLFFELFIFVFLCGRSFVRCHYYCVCSCFLVVFIFCMRLCVVVCVGVVCFCFVCDYCFCCSVLFSCVDWLVSRFLCICICLFHVFSSVCVVFVVVSSCA